MRALLGLLPLLLASLTGCVDNPAAPLATSDRSEAPATVPSTALVATDEANAPTWPVGTAFGHHVFFGADDTEGEHYNTIVTSDEGDSYFLASDNDAAAKDDAAFDIPILGAVRKSDLHVTGLGGDWDLFKFPLRDGTTWTSTFTVELQDFQRQWEVTHVAKFNPAIETPAGPRPGWDITGTTADGERLLFYDYVPDLGWYAHLFVYDVETPEEDDYVFHVMSMGRKADWIGPYFVYEGKQVAEVIGGMALDPDAPTEPFVGPRPRETFTMDEGATLLYGFVFAIAVGGLQEIVLLDPNGERHAYQAVGTPAAEEGENVDIPSVPGEWQIVAVGAGAVAIEVAFLWQLTARHGEL